MQSEIVKSILELLYRAFPSLQSLFPEWILQASVVVIILIPLLKLVIELARKLNGYAAIHRAWKEMGIRTVWADRYQGFPKGRQQYRAFCEQLIDKAPASSTIKLMTTVGSGAAIFIDGLGTPFQNALKRGCSFRIVLQNPCSKEIPERIKAIQSSAPKIYEHKYDDLPEQIAKRLGYIFDWIEEVNKDPEIKNPDITVRCTESSPTINFIDNGKQALVAFATVNHVGGEFPVFLVDKGKKLHSYCGSYFNYVFGNAMSAQTALQRYKKRNSA